MDEYRSGEWGDHVTLQAAADLVCLIMAFFLLGLCRIIVVSSCSNSVYPFFPVSSVNHCI